MIEHATHRGLVRRTNEDAVAAVAIPGGTLLVVADGIGGVPGGEIASRLAVDAVLDRLGDGGSAGVPPADALRVAFAEASRRVRARQSGGESSMGTTLVAALIRDGDACVVNVGDSRAYVADAHGLRQVTRDHSWVEEEIRAGRLAPNDPLVPARRHIITRAIGGALDNDAADADVFDHVPLAPGATLLLCSDGLHGMVPDDEIAALIRARRRPGAAGPADRLIDAALSHGGADNVSVALYTRPSGRVSAREPGDGGTA